jgi:hypothetical protein|tara:strand:+ start:1133 stop:1618 length:486 start_codon:yes stop_codon:yes gene_type:complete
MKLEVNNGDALSCIVLIVDSLARENDSKVVIETIHKEDCQIFESAGISHGSEVTDLYPYKLGDDWHERLAHLYSCNCDVGMEAVFTKEDGESLLVSFPLSEMKHLHPWLNDDKLTKEMLDGAKEMGDESDLVRGLKPIFKQRVGTNLGTSFGAAHPFRTMH